MGNDAVGVINGMADFQGDIKFTEYIEYTEKYGK